MSFCLPREFATKFIEALKTGDIDPAKLGGMTSAERRTYFEKFVGKEDAKAVNALFESKLILKNQQQGMITWAKQVSGIKPEVRRDMIAKIERLKEVLTPETETAFLEDLASTRLKIDITFEEARKISEMSTATAESKTKVSPDEPIGSPNRLEYGANKIAMMEYVNSLKLESEKLSVKEKIGEFKKSPVGAVMSNASDIAGFAKAMKSSLDDSAIFRQGWKTLFTNPKIWADNATQSFINIKKTLGKNATDDSVINGVKAEIHSRPNAMNGLYEKMKLDIGNIEEAFPTSLPQKIPLFGRLYNASQTAYTAFLYRLRADIADKYIEIAKDNKIDLTDELQTKSIGKLVNSLTGRGSIGSFEKVAKPVNNIFFSVRLWKSTLDFLTLHAFDKMSPFARREAAKNLLKVASGMAVILGTAKALDPDSVEFDPRSSDFGKIRVGNTRFDVSGGMASMVVFASRMLTRESKSSITGKITDLDSGKYGAKTTGDVFSNYMTNKFSPATAFVKDMVLQKTFTGEKPTIAGELSNLFVPLPIANIIETAKDPNGANVIIAGVADALGIGTNTYGPRR